MAAPHLTHDIVCIGSHDPNQHDFHAANARALHDLMTGGLGPSRLISECLAGPRVKVSAVESALQSSADRAAKNHVIYFSGRGTAAGLEVSDGTISAEMLSRHIAQVRTHAVLLVLDLSIGAALDQALAPPWLRALVESRSCVRAAVARATRIGAGAEGEGLARFTAALVAALESAPSDVRLDRLRFISDKLAMEHVRRVLGERWGMTNFPLELGTFGDMPLTRSQASAPVGTASLNDIGVGAGLSASVTWVVEGRAHMTTMLEYVLERRDGTVLGSGSVPIVPKNPLQKGKTRVRLSRTILGRRGSSASRPLELRWRVSLRDARDRLLAQRVLDFA